MDPLRRKDDSGGDHRASQRTPSRLVEAGNPLVASILEHPFEKVLGLFWQGLEEHGRSEAPRPKGRGFPVRSFPFILCPLTPPFPLRRDEALAGQCKMENSKSSEPGYCTFFTFQFVSGSRSFFYPNPCSFAFQVSQIEEFGSSDLSPAHHIDMLDSR